MFSPINLRLVYTNVSYGANVQDQRSLHQAPWYLYFLFVCLLVCLFVGLVVCLLVCLFVCLFVRLFSSIDWLID